MEWSNTLEIGAVSGVHGALHEAMPSFRGNLSVVWLSRK